MIITILSKSLRTGELSAKLDKDGRLAGDLRAGRGKERTRAATLNVAVSGQKRATRPILVPVRSVHELSIWSSRGFDSSRFQISRGGMGFLGPWRVSRKFRLQDS